MSTRAPSIRALSIRALLAGVLLLGGCAGGGSEPAAEQPAATATTALTTAAARLRTETFKATVALGRLGSMTGVTDPVNGNSEFVMESTAGGNEITTTLRVVAGVTYVRIRMADSKGMPGLDGRKWRRVDGTGAAGTLGSIDATQMSKSLESALDVRWVDGDTVEGTVDLAESARQLGAGTAATSQLTSTELPFEASFDVKGRLSEYRFTMPETGSTPAFEMVMTYSDFGTPVSVKAPAAKDVIA